MKKIFSLLLYLLLCFQLLQAQHLKKDGTPDRRYKENRENYSSSSYPTPSATGYTSNSTSNSETHLKKDGTPDRRYKENDYTTTSTVVPKYESTTNNSYSIKRDSKGKIVRSAAAKNEFKRQSGYSKGRPGYVIDHIKPLKKGGCDCPENMQWQTVAEGKAKDKWE